MLLAYIIVEFLECLSLSRSKFNFVYRLLSYHNLCHVACLALDPDPHTGMI